MGQLPLGFGKSKPPPKGGEDPPGPRPPYLTVQALLRELRGRLESEFRFVLVKGEVSNVSIPRSGHLYFTLKEAQAQIRCVLWRDQQAKLRFQLRDGLTVLVRAKVTVFDRGDLSLNVLHVEPVGEGALQQAYKDLAEKLRREGLTDPAGKRALPSFPRAIGVVTSKSGAALKDVLRTVWRRNPGQSVVLAPTEVQGQGAAQKIAQALSDLDGSGRVEVILLVRGGGSLEDLWAFNEEGVARSIVACRVPVVTGIGHETDTTIADLVADRRASTPTGAAEEATPDRRALSAHLGQLEGRLLRATRAHLARQTQQLLRLERRLPDPRTRLLRHAQRIDALLHRAERRVGQHLTRAERRLEQQRQLLARQRPDRVIALRRAHLAQLLGKLTGQLPPRLAALRRRLGEAEATRDRRLDQRLRAGRHRLEKVVLALEARSPLGVLARGYALVTDEAGRVQRNAERIADGQRLELRLAEGTRWARAEAKEEER